MDERGRKCKGNSTRTSKRFDPFLFYLPFVTKGVMPDKRQENKPDAVVTSRKKQLSTRTDANISSVGEINTQHHRFTHSARHTKTTVVPVYPKKSRYMITVPQACLASPDKTYENHIFCTMCDLCSLCVILKGMCPCVFLYVLQLGITCRAKH